MTILVANREREQVRRWPKEIVASRDLGLAKQLKWGVFCACRAPKYFTARNSWKYRELAQLL